MISIYEWPFVGTQWYHHEDVERKRRYVILYHAYDTETGEPLVQYSTLDEGAPTLSSPMSKFMGYSTTERCRRFTEVPSGDPSTPVP